MLSGRWKAKTRFLELSSLRVGRSFSIFEVRAWGNFVGVDARADRACGLGELDIKVKATGVSSMLPRGEILSTTGLNSIKWASCLETLR